jgi:hypothetical protein
MLGKRKEKGQKNKYICIYISHKNKATACTAQRAL